MAKKEKVNKKETKFIVLKNKDIGEVLEVIKEDGRYYYCKTENGIMQIRKLNPNILSTELRESDIEELVEELVEEAEKVAPSDVKEQERG